MAGQPPKVSALEMFLFAALLVVIYSAWIIGWSCLAYRSLLGLGEAPRCPPLLACSVVAASIGVVALTVGIAAYTRETIKKETDDE